MLKILKKRYSLLFYGLTLLSFAVFLGCAKSSQNESAPAPVSDPAPVSAPEKASGDSVVAWVNDAPVTVSNLQEGQQGQPPKNPSDLLDMAIGRELLFQEAKKENLIATTEEVDDLFTSVAAKAGGVEKFNQILLRSGNSPKEIRTRIKRDVSINKIANQLTEGKVNIEDASIESYYASNPDQFINDKERISASHILAQTKELSAEEKVKALEKIESVKQRLASGEDFAALAGEHS